MGRPSNCAKRAMPQHNEPRLIDLPHRQSAGASSLK
jgi:hypothetical protein